MTTTNSEIDLATADRHEMLRYARDELGLAPPKTITKEGLAELIGKQTGQAAVTNKDLSPAETKMMAELRRQKKVRIRIAEHRDHPKRIFVGINGVPYSIKPGAWVEVPESVAKVLSDAIRTHFHQESDDNGKIRTIASNGPAYPFEIDYRSAA